MAVIRQDIIKEITDRPGDVVYRSEIAESTGYSEAQVSAAVLAIQKSSPIGVEVESVVRGRAWRYTPRRPRSTSSDTTRVARDTTLPLTTLIREYLIDKAGTTVWASELATYTGRDEYQIKVGVNNMRRIRSNEDVAPYVTTMVPGQAWQFDPPHGWRAGLRRPVVMSPVASTSTTQPATDVATSTPVAVTSSAAADDEPSNDSVLIFELVGRTDDAIIVKDDTDALYRVTRL